MKKLFEGYIRIVGAINSRVKFIGILFIFMTFIMVYEVVARFIFNAPTRWAWDINIQILCFTTIMSGGYTLFHQGHVKMDIFYSRFSKKKKAVVDLLTSFLPLSFTGVLLYHSYDLARDSIRLREVDEGLLHAPLYPLRIAIVVGIFLLLIQVVADVLRNILVLLSEDHNHFPKL